MRSHCSQGRDQLPQKRACALACSRKATHHKAQANAAYVVCMALRHVSSLSCMLAEGVWQWSCETLLEGGS